MKKEKFKEVKAAASSIVDAGKKAVAEGRRENDTIRLWEGYKDQAILWRTLTLLQLPVTAALVIFCLVLWSTRTVKVLAPAEAKPGTVAIADIPDNHFVDMATDFINLIGTYRWATAERQFQEARKFLIEPTLTRFDQEIYGSELRAIQATNRSQFLFVDPSKTKLERKRDEVTVTFTGDRQKYVSGKEIPSSELTITLTMKTIPKNVLNPLGIVISKFNVDLTD